MVTLPFSLVTLTCIHRVLSPSKNLLVDTIRIVIDDMTWFLVFLGLTMLGFAFAFYR
jgi:hypothetical protein